MAAIFSALDFSAAPRLVNVASVPQRSLFRYPGGKTWLVPVIRAWVAARAERPRLFLEPFVGGGIVALTVAAENLAERVLIVERDPQVAAVWRVVLSEDAGKLAQRTLDFELSRERAVEALAGTPTSDLDLAFQTILRNRVQRGGILAAGAGLIRHGENGKGISSRWYPQTLARRIREIATLRHRIRFIEGDALKVIPRHLANPDAAWFVDPPYTAGGKRAGRRLYRHNEVDHEQLFANLRTARGRVLMTYDDAPEVRALATQFGFGVRAVPMKNTHHREMCELLIHNDSADGF